MRTLKHIPVAILGVGGVGRALLRQVVAGRDAVANRNQLHFDIVALADSQSWLWQPAGLADAQLRDAVQAKEQHRALGWKRPSHSEILEAMQAAGLERALIVDVTAEDGLEPLLDQALEMGYGIVLANKKPLTGPWTRAKRYFHNSRVRHESTVGGGQPVIAIIRYLLDTNDLIDRVEGQMSGTLGYICGRLDQGIAFSEAVAEAMKMGYTEPDPREDLGGRDVMRKIMILGRLAGWPLEEADITVETLYEPSLAHLTVDDFMRAVSVMDLPIRERVAAARTEGKVLRYAAEVESSGGRVGLKAFPKETPLAHLKYISLHTSLYNEQPMMIAGKGAGVEMTAAGVLGDMIGLTREE